MSLATRLSSIRMFERRPELKSLRDIRFVHEGASFDFLHDDLLIEGDRTLLHREAFLPDRIVIPAGQETDIVRSWMVAPDGRPIGLEFEIERSERELPTATHTRVSRLTFVECLSAQALCEFSWASPEEVCERLAAICLSTGACRL